MTEEFIKVMEYEMRSRTHHKNDLIRVYVPRRILED